MASITQSSSTESSTETTENDDFAPLPITSGYLSLQALHSLLKDAIGAAENLTMSDDDKPTVMWVRMVEDALYTRDGSLGEMQGETSYTTKDFTDTYGDSITTEHAGLQDGERTRLKALFNESENHDVSILDDDFKLPSVNDERLPLLVADEDVLEDAEALLEKFVAQFDDNDAPSTPDAVDEDDNENVFSILEGTLDDLEAHLAGSTPQEETLREMLEEEKANKDRKGGKKLIEDAIEERSTTDDDDDEADDDDVAKAVEEADDDTDERSTTDDGMTDEDKEEIATAVATAVVEALSE